MTQQSTRRSSRSRLLWAMFGILLLVGLVLAIVTMGVPGVWDGGNV